MMKSFLIIATLAASTAALVSRADLTINTPPFFPLKYYQLSLSVVTLHLVGLVELCRIRKWNRRFESLGRNRQKPGNSDSGRTRSPPGANPLPGTGFKFAVEDSTGITATTAVVTVGTGSDSCLLGGGTATGSSDIAELAVICTDINYGGNCIEFVSPPFDSAHPLGCAPLQAPYACNISSAHGVTDGYSSFLYPQLGCLGTRLVISGQIPDFRAASVNFNDKALSWSCGSALTSV
ncbi:hypothetical protein B0H13DRAFT_1857762 [Mycena leptocephala]|nr:hypothetical protein B0H13DRAFT_1857762 [Mycena leptocephala]